MSGDPMLNGITRVTIADQSRMGLVPAVLGEYVLFSDLPALIAAARAEERERIQSEALDAITMHVLTGEDHAAFLYRLDRILNPEWKP